MKSQIKSILEQVHKGELSPDDALKKLKDFPYQDLDFAKVDHHRELRKGFPEIIFGLGKTEDQIVKIAEAILKVVWTIKGPIQLGKIARKIIRAFPAPMDRAAIT